MSDTSLFLQLLGDLPLFRILDFLIEHKGLDFSKQAIAEGAGISKASLFNYWPSLQAQGLVKETRRFGKTALYSLDTDCDITQRLLDLEAALIRRSLQSAKQETLVPA